MSTQEQSAWFLPEVDIGCTKKSCKDIKLSRVYNKNVENMLPMYWYCERQNRKRKVSCYHTNLGYRYSYSTPSILLRVINIYCRLNEEASPLNKTFTFYRRIKLFKIYVTLILFQFLFLCFYFHQSQAPYSIQYR